MRNILRRSVGTTISTDGQPATGPSSGHTSKDHADAMEEAIKLLSERYPDLKISRASRWTVFRYTTQERWHKLIHPLGFHLPLEAEEWDPETASVKYLGRRCQICGSVC